MIENGRPFSRSILATALLLLNLTHYSYSQCLVSKDRSGSVITICKWYLPSNGLLINRPDKSQSQTTVVYTGSPYLSYPIYEDGLLEYQSNNEKVPCKIAFNLATNQVFCRLENDSSELAIFPDIFTVGTKRFINKSDLSGKRAYYMVLYAGRSKVLLQTKIILKTTERRPYETGDLNDGSYIKQERYFIELDDGSLRAVRLSKKSILKALGGFNSQTLSMFKGNKITVWQMVKTVAEYDGFS
ncbi:hypothetical protein L0663_18145 [Dyadobacter sp. CY107]|uniref:hypothetical protein n=1 Tax=Dyadobacter fanqingshengii TaxID=2906443 RepID=UPI001F325947|nr:hypothetical protein [Dyadobacter fanqingshengii]MCF2505319.1 hypothetical protein [Dyadobacter fanqingshengii]